jgi:hypothetical protein
VPARVIFAITCDADDARSLLERRDAVKRPQHLFFTPDDAY